MGPAIRFAVNKDGDHVAYATEGEGELDIVFVPDWVTNLEVMREEPSIAQFFDRLSSIGRLILFDKRGSGLSDPVPFGAIPTPEEWMDDIRTVLDDLDSKRAVIFGHGEGGTLALLFAASHPERTEALILADTCARRRRAADYECGIPGDAAQRVVDYVLQTWGTGQAAVLGAPSLSPDPRFVERRARLERLAMSPGMFSALYPPTYERDVRVVLDTIRVPTLILHRRGNPYIRFDNGRYLAEHIRDARFVPLDGDDHFFHAGDFQALLAEAQEFLTGSRESPDHDRILATVLFTDIVDATGLAARLGDRNWKALLDRHHEIVRGELARFRGREVDTAGDGFFATFDGPARGVRCALAIRDVLRSIGIEIRAGLHTGECELIGDKIGGIAVHIGARICGCAARDEVLVSRTVRDLVVGSGLEFTSAGHHRLKGIESEWELLRVD